MFNSGPMDVGLVTESGTFTRLSPNSFDSLPYQYHLIFFFERFAVTLFF